jgi:hypothetical protein
LSALRELELWSYLDRLRHRKLGHGRGMHHRRRRKLFQRSRRQIARRGWEGIVIASAATVVAGIDQREFFEVSEIAYANGVPITLLVK